MEFKFHPFLPEIFVVLDKKTNMNLKSTVTLSVAMSDLTAIKFQLYYIQLLFVPNI